MTWQSENTQFVVIQWSGSTPISNPITGNTYTFTGLSTFTEYNVTIRPTSPSGVQGRIVKRAFRSADNVATLSASSLVNVTSNSITTNWISGPGYAYAIVRWNNGTSSKISNSQSYIALGLIPDTAYSFTITPYNRDNVAGVTSTHSTTTTPLAGLTSASTSNVQATQVTLNWEGVNYAYVIVTWPGAGTSQQQYGTSYIVSGLTDNSMYTFTITAYNALNAALNTLSVTITTPLSVPTLTSTSITSTTFNSVNFTWTGNYSYVVVTWPGGTSNQQSGTSYTATGLSSSTSYTFTITPYNANNVSGTPQTQTVTTSTQVLRNKQFPPTNWNNLSSDTMVVSSASYGNGTYVAVGTNTQDPTNYAAQRAFQFHGLLWDGPSYNFWHSTSQYVNTGSLPGGTYKGTTSTTDVSGNIYMGEYLQLQLPIAILYGGVSIQGRSHHWGNVYVWRTPRDFSVLGSNNGTTWTLLQSMTGVNTTTNEVINYTSGLTSESDTTYTYIRMVIHSIGNSTEPVASKDAINIRAKFIGGIP